MREWKIICVCIAAMMLIMGTAFAQIENGDFEMGGDGWKVDQEPSGYWLIRFPDQGGHPDGFADIWSYWSEGESCIYQEFECGEPGDNNCIITFDYNLETFGAWIASSIVYRLVKVYVDDNLLFTSPEEGWFGWTNGTVVVACGTHVISLCLWSIDTSNGWVAGFDNVTADCAAVANDNLTWSHLKALYR